MIDQVDLDYVREKIIYQGDNITSDYIESLINSIRPRNHWWRWKVPGVKLMFIGSFVLTLGPIFSAYFLKDPYLLYFMPFGVIFSLLRINIQVNREYKWLENWRVELYNIIKKENNV